MQIDELYTKQQLSASSTKRSHVGGDTAIFRKQQSLDIMLSADGSLIKATTSTSNSSQNLQQHLGQTNEKQQHQVHYRLDAHDKLDFGPVHRCCQIFNVLVNFNYSFKTGIF